MTSIAPEMSGSLSQMQDSAVDQAVMGALAGSEDPYEPGEGESEVETVVDKASQAESAAEKAAKDVPTKLKIQEIPESDAEPTIVQRNEDGTFKAKVPAKVDAKVDGVPQPTETAEVPEVPKERPKLATDFKLYGKDGAELDVYDVMDKLGEVEIPWKGETKRVPLDRLARLAQSGLHNEQQYAAAQSALASHALLTERVRDAEERIKRQNAYVASLLDSDEVLNDSRERWQSHNTPEARAERAERRAMDLEAQLNGQSRTETAASFYEKDVKAPIQALLSQYPTVTEAELIGQTNILTAGMGAEIQPKDFAAVRAILRDDLPAFAASVHETRSAHQSELRKAQEKITLLKRSQAMGARPTGRVASASESKAPRKEPRTNDERIDAIIDDEIMKGF